MFHTKQLGNDRDVQCSAPTEPPRSASASPSRRLRPPSLHSSHHALSPPLDLLLHADLGFRRRRRRQNPSAAAPPGGRNPAMSVIPPASFSSWIARYRLRSEHRRLPLKRKLDDYVPLDSNQFLRMQSPDREADSDPDLLSTASSSGDQSAPTLHFFVRTISGTLVIHAFPDDTVESVIEHIRDLTGIASVELRLIYRGRQLQTDLTLAECEVETDACLNLTARLRSTRFPIAWQIMNDLVSAVCSLVACAGDDRRRASKEKSVDSLLKEFLTKTPSKEPGKADETTWGHLQVFVLAGAPPALVKLYLSVIPANKALAESAIRLFLNSNSDYLPKYIQDQCASIVLEFCKFLSGAAGKEDPLYVSCRSMFAALVKAQDSRLLIHSMSTAVISDIFPFVSELAEILMQGLSSESMLVSSSDLTVFSNLLHAVRQIIRDWMGGSDPIPRELYCTTHPMYEDWIGALNRVFEQLVQSADQFLGRVEEFLKRKGAIQFDNCLVIWSRLLDVLTELKTFAEIFEGGDELLCSVLVTRRVSLNALVKRAKRNDNLLWLLKHKNVTDFEARRNLVLMMFPDGKDDYDELHEMLIDRSQLLAESFEYIGQAEAHTLHGGLFMEFKNEEATGPGVLREWFCLLCRAIFNPQNVLFVPCPHDHRRFFPNPASMVDPLHLKYFGFCGRVIALALMHKVQVGIVFDRVFFMQLSGKTISLEDVPDADPCLYMSCKKILEMDGDLLDSDVLGLTFVREIEELGAQRAIELCPGGKDIAVNSKNRVDYVNLLIQHHFVTSISEQISHFAQGFSDILSNSKLQKFFFQSLDLEDFDRMLGGSNDIVNVKEWRAHTEYNGYKAKDHQICWFWKIVEGMPAEQKRVLLYFWTSVKYLPVDGFGGLSSKLYIYKSSDSHDRLPTSHTCFYRLCLPPYPSISMMHDRLQFITQEHVSCSFGIW